MAATIVSYIVPARFVIVCFFAVQKATKTSFAGGKKMLTDRNIEKWCTNTHTHTHARTHARTHTHTHTHTNEHTHSDLLLHVSYCPVCGLPLVSFSVASK